MGSTDKELSKQLKSWQKNAGKLILDRRYECIRLSDLEHSVLEKLMNAEKPNEINNYLWNSGCIEQTLKSIADRLKNVK